MNYGEIWQLGKHKLMCGDATNPDDIAKLIDGEHVDLILTDPPYGMKCQNKNGAIGDYNRILYPPKERGQFNYGRKNPIRANSYSLIIGDNSPDTAKKFYENVKDLDAVKIIWGGQYFADFLPINGGWLFWDKMTGDTDFSDGELAWCSKGKRVRKYTQTWSGVCRAGSRDLEMLKRVHPTQKPVELHARILEDFSKEGNIILDCFGGSGTTLIACEITNRKCLMMEISPEYCEIIKSRWENLNPLFTQGQAVRIA